MYPTQTMYDVPYPNYVYCTLPKLCMMYPTQTMYIVPYPNYVYCTLLKLCKLYPTQTMYDLPYPNYVYCILPKLCVLYPTQNMYDVYCTDASKKWICSCCIIVTSIYVSRVKICKGVCTVFSPEPFAFYCIFDYSNLRRSLLLKYKAAKSKHIYHA